MQPKRTFRALLLEATRLVVPIGMTVALVIGATLGGVIGVGLSAQPAGADQTSETLSDELEFVGLINELRTAGSLAPLVVSAELTAQARSWSDTMAASDQLAHSPDMTVGISTQWAVLGENVGVHGIHDLNDLFQAFVNSPSHYKNLMDPRYQYLGVGVTHSSGGKLWTTHRFMAVPAAPAPDPVQTTPAPTTPTTTPVTVPIPTTVPTPTTGAPPTTATEPEPSAEPGTTAPPVPTTEPAKEPTGQTPPNNPSPEPATAPTTDRTTGPGRDRAPSPSGGDDQTATDAPGGGEADAPSTSGGAADANLPAGANQTSATTLDTERREMAELVKPDPETVEDVLHELVLAGI